MDLSWLPDVMPASPAVRITVAVVILLLAGFVALNLYLQRSEHRARAEELREMEQSLQRQRAYYEARLRSQQQAAVWRHDINSHLRTLRYLLQDGQTEQARNYTVQLCREADAQAAAFTAACAQKKTPPEAPQNGQ